MPPKRLLAHYKIDAKRNRLLMVSCNAEDMLLPRSTFTFYGTGCVCASCNVGFQKLHVMELHRSLGVQKATPGHAAFAAANL